MGIHVLIRSFRIYVHNNSDKMFKSIANAFILFYYLCDFTPCSIEHSLYKVTIRVIVYENCHLMTGSNSLSAPRFIRLSATIMPVSEDV